MALATVSANSKSAQVKSTRKPASSSTPQAKESPVDGLRSLDGPNGLKSLIEIIERGSFYEQDRPLDPSDVSELYDAAENHVKHARALSNRPDWDHAQYFATRLADLQACVAASKSGEFSLPPREMKRMAGVFAMKLFREISEWAEIVSEEGRETLKETMKKFA